MPPVLEHALMLIAPTVHCVVGTGRAGCNPDSQLLCSFPTDAAGWQILAALLQQKEQPEAAVEALLMSKCVKEPAIELTAAKSILTGDAKAALGELGDPDLVHSYQASNGDQVTALLWQGKKLARLYVLGEFNSEVTWCN